MQLFQAGVRKLAQTLGRTLPRTHAADIRLTVQQASDTLKQLRQRDALQPKMEAPSMRYPAMVIGFLHPMVCTAVSVLRGGRGCVCHHLRQKPRKITQQSFL